MRFKRKKTERIVIYTDKESKEMFKELAKKANVSMSALGRVFIGLTDIIKIAVKEAIREIGFFTTPKPLEQLTPPTSIAHSLTIDPSIAIDPALRQYRRAFGKCIVELKEVLSERKKRVDEYSENES